MMRYFLLFTFVIASSVAAVAAQQEIRPGQYVLDGDSGTLTIHKGERNRLTFEIETIGGNCHSCSVSGVISGTIGHTGSLADDGNDSKCEISFSASRSAIVVRPITEEACRDYCGMRAGFDGTFRIPPAACTSADRQRLRDQFLHQYRARQFTTAGNTLQSLIAQCKDFIGWIEIDQVRNDLSLAEYHSGKFQQCLATLSATLAAKAKDEEELKSGNGDVYLPPCDFDNYVDVARRTWFNKALCTKAMPKER